MSDLVGRSDQRTALSSARPQIDILTPVPDQAERTSLIVHKPRGFFGRVGLGVSASVVIVVGGFMLSRLHASDWLLPYLENLHPDGSRIDALHRDNIPGLRAGEVQLVLASADGGVLRVAAPKQEVENFQREMLFFLKSRQESAVADYERSVTAAFNTAFADSEKALGDYADWYFEWKRSWIMMKEAVAGGASELTSLSTTKVWDGATGRVRGYLMDNYQSRVLQPDMRQPILQRGLGEAFQTAHTRFRAVVDELGGRESAFVREHTRLLERYPSGSVSLALDWGAQKWKIPAHMAEDRAEKVYRDAGIMGASFVVTPLLMPVLRGVGERIFGEVAARVMADNGNTLVGVYLGPETLGASVLIGAGMDYVINRLDRHLNRDNFLDDHRKALSETRAGWEALAREQLVPVVRSWYGDTQTAMMAMERK